MKPPGSGCAGRPLDRPRTGEALAYDSFLVKIWHDAGTESWRRVEVRHVQTDLMEAGRDVDEQWLGRALVALLDNVSSQEP